MPVQPSSAEELPETAVKAGRHSSCDRLPN